MRAIATIINVLVWGLLLSTPDAGAQNSINMENLNMTDEWDKIFPQSNKVEHSKVSFHNRYGITLAADLYRPKGAEGPFASIAVCGPYGADKEQVSGLYAQTLAERGFLTIAFDPSFYGESGGEPRYLTSPEISVDDFSAAVDYLVTNPEVDPERVGIIGICGWAVSLLLPPPTTRASRQQLPRRCTTCAA